MLYMGWYYILPLRLVGTEIKEQKREFVFSQLDAHISLQPAELYKNRWKELFFN